MIQNILPSYLYQQYSDDSDLQAFVAAFNQLAQGYLDAFNTLNLPIYTADVISGTLLDWVAQGIYGMIRPVLPSGIVRTTGPFNTECFNNIEFNTTQKISTGAFYQTNDDIFKRILTWNFYKGDGFQVNITWLKRRIMRFLIGQNGTAPPIDETYRISITETPGNINIAILNNIRTVTGGAIFNVAPFNSVPYNSVETTVTPLEPFTAAPFFVDAVQAGVLNLPFQYTFSAVIL